ncbi:DnaD domain protein [Lysinibacillus sp.]|uniref:DnaD domain protein n=1 Tax=Lysinibacillus sp. TaxID=1869345 RepID=UPI0028AC906C|nr:DnaD domain protein [Lysinibacillus sp.]
MAKFRLVHTSFWNDPRVVEEMTAEDKYFFLYLLTNESTTQIGIYQITKKQIAFDLGYSPESANALLQRFIEHHKLIRYNAETREIAIKNWGKYNLVRGGKPILDCVKSELKNVKDTTLIEWVGESIPNDSIRNVYESYYDTSAIRDENAKSSNIKGSYVTSHDTSTISGQEEEKEEEKEKEEEQDKDKEEKQLGQSVAPSLIDHEFLAIKNFFDQAIRVSNFTDHKKMDNLLKLYPDHLLIIEAIKVTADNGKSNMEYVEAILRNWRTEKGVKSYADWQVKINAETKRSNGSNYGQAQSQKPSVFGDYCSD